ncbi:rab-interacting lysosomal protein isoform X2 [Dromiciops gliroides]|uniref:rab-interacting lysosomal protein isoform X2 n=1 Tax=Dromiciops gliroides TaxID=33562 RepID=UPI001CC60734|nr:rab-interacting lysosomal protein isoform X2 [Dromiciops gliroides]
MEPAGASRLSPDLVYQLAGTLGTELQRLASRFGPGAVARLVPHVVRSLELLEGAAAGAPPDPEEGKGASERAPRSPPRELRDGDDPREERLLLRQLKQVTDRQRDQLRAQSRDLQLRVQEVEAEQLQRLLRVNGELRGKVAAVQVQLRAALQRAADAEGARDQAAAREAPQGAPEQAVSRLSDAEPPAQGKPNGFSREEVSQILQERNELKANVFLLQEELNYYHRELLTDQWVPGFLLNAMKLTVKKQRRKIKAKMLGTPDEPGSSDEGDDDDDSEGGSWLPPSVVDGASPPAAPESRIRSFFSLWYRGSPEPPLDPPQTGDPSCSQEELSVEEKELPAPPPSGGTS